MRASGVHSLIVYCADPRCCAGHAWSVCRTKVPYPTLSSFVESAAIAAQTFGLTSRTPPANTILKESGFSAEALGRQHREVRAALRRRDASGVENPRPAHSWDMGNHVSHFCEDAMAATTLRISGLFWTGLALPLVAVLYSSPISQPDRNVGYGLGSLAMLWATIIITLVGWNKSHRL